MTLLPFAAFVALKVISEAILAPATGNTSDLSGCAIATIFSNLKIYYNSVCAWLSFVCDDAVINLIKKLMLLLNNGEDPYGVIQRLCGILTELCVGAAMLLCAAGVVLKGLRRELHLTIFSAVYLLIVCMLPYNQGVRYVYPVMILMPIYIGHALCAIGRARILSFARHKAVRAAMRLAAFALCVLTFISAVSGIIYTRNYKESIAFEPAGRAETLSGLNAYSPYAIEAYDYIINNTPADCVIGFNKPRALFLNTERLSIRTDVNGHSLDEVDYLLTCATVGEKELERAGGESFREVFSNADFTLYKKADNIPQP